MVNNVNAFQWWSLLKMANVSGERINEMPQTRLLNWVWRMFKTWKSSIYELSSLFQESETLETQNLDLKTKIQELEDERRKLVEVLSVHRPSCKKQSFAPSPSVYTEYSRSEYSASTGSYPSVSYEVRTSESSSTSYQHHHSTTATVIEDIAYTPHAYLGVYRERLPRDPIITYAQSGVNEICNQLFLTQGIEQQ